jgi:hypothetical protein
VFGNSQAVFRADDESSACSSGPSVCESSSSSLASTRSAPASANPAGVGVFERVGAFFARVEAGLAQLHGLDDEDEESTPSLTSTSSAVVVGPARIVASPASTGLGEQPRALFSSSSLDSVEEDREESADGEQTSSTTVAEVTAVVPAAVVDAASKKEESAFQELVAKHAGTAAYKALYPKIESVLRRKLEDFFYGTDQIVMTSEGQTLRVLNDPSKGIVDAVLRKLGVNSTVRFGVRQLNLFGIISGKKAEIEASLQSALGFNSLDTLVQHLTQKLTLKALGYAVNTFQAPAREASQVPAVNAFQAPARKLTLSEIANMQQAVSIKDERAKILAEQAEKADLEFVKNYLLYEIKSMLNNLSATAAKLAIGVVLSETKKETVHMWEGGLDVLTKGGVVMASTLGGPLYAMIAACLWTINRLFGAEVAGAGYDVVKQGVINTMRGACDFAPLPITRAEIEQYHAVVTTVNTTDQDDTIFVNSVVEDSYANRFVFGRAAPAVEMVGRAVKTVATGTIQVVSGVARTVAPGAVGAARKLGSWFGY